MRLINTQTLQLEDFPFSTIPPYAILSHTWSDGEVTFQDMSIPSSQSKKGYDKIRHACQLALESGIEYVWVDTCCIDKSSSAELTESINSMFRWYSDAVVCYAYLEDLQPQGEFAGDLHRCRWITRGWTLQELIAPNIVQFYDMTWAYRGTKHDFPTSISEMTRIPRDVLLGEKNSLSRCGISMKMSWAAKRESSRLEDNAYCLLGIFGVNMPLIYGEGARAFRRLQEEIVKSTNDLTIFAWEHLDPDRDSTCLFADSPLNFLNGAQILPFRDEFVQFSVTNHGLKVSGDYAETQMRAVSVPDARGERRYALFLGMSISGKPGGITLRKIGPRLYYREKLAPLIGIDEIKTSAKIYEWAAFDPGEYYIRIDPYDSDDMDLSVAHFREDAIHVPDIGQFQIHSAVPQTMWDATDRVFLNRRHNNYYNSVVIAMKFKGTLPDGETFVTVGVLCDYQAFMPICKIFDADQYPQLRSSLFHGSNRKDSISWQDSEASSLQSIPDTMEVATETSVFRITLGLPYSDFESSDGNDTRGGLRASSSDSTNTDHWKVIYARYNRRCQELLAQCVLYSDAAETKLMQSSMVTARVPGGAVFLG